MLNQSVPLGDDLKSILIEKAYRFWKRDFSEDVRNVNLELAKYQQVSAGFREDIPAIPFSSYPFDLFPGNCIAIIGLNPAYQNPKKLTAYREQVELQQFHKEGRAGFNKFLKNRADYFTESNLNYHGGHFTKLGGFLGRTLLSNAAEYSVDDKLNCSMKIFRNFVFVSDFLPWFSENTKNTSAQKVSSSKSDSLMMYRSLLSDILCVLKPRWIQCNGLQMAQYAECVFGLGEGGLIERRYGENEKWRILVSRIEIEPSDDLKEIVQPLRTFLCLHNFTSSRSGQSFKHFSKMSECLRTWIGDEERFQFDMLSPR
ncbi:MAG: hypothetical protein WD044_13290 [Dongiaceae bacterium]